MKLNVLSMKNQDVSVWIGRGEGYAYHCYVLSVGQRWNELQRREEKSLQVSKKIWNKAQNFELLYHLSF